MAAFELIQSITLGTDSQYITFSNIPQTYTDLLCVTSLRNNGAGYGGYVIQPNAVTTGWLSRGVSVTSTTVNNYARDDLYDQSFIHRTMADNQGGWGNDYFYIARYTGSQEKSFYTHSAVTSPTTTTNRRMLHNYAMSGHTGSAVSSLRLGIVDTNQLLAGSTASLYGISNA